MRFDGVVGFPGPLWLEASQPLPEVAGTMALLRAWRQARPQQVLIGFYVYAGQWQQPPVAWMICSN